MLSGGAQAILWAQWRSLLNFYRRPQMGGAWVGSIVMGLWYLMVAIPSVGIGIGLSYLRADRYPNLETYCAFGLLGAFLYWQLVPVFLASTGLAIDLRKLMVYPIEPRQLFQIEVLLRVSTGIEVLMLLSGAFFGLLFNASVPKWAPFTLFIFVVLNLYLSAGIRDWMARIMERKGAREILVLSMVVITVLPQMVAFVGLPPAVKDAFFAVNQSWLPWGAAAGAMLGHRPAVNVPLLLLWTAGAVAFGRWQFERSLRFDTEAARAKSSEGMAGSARFDRLFTWPSALFRDPLGALLEKELRQLARAPRFRLVFFMGFTFGLVVWLPLTFGKGLMTGVPVETGPFASNYLTWVSVYSVMMLGEVAIFNNMGFDRMAAQFYWIAPAPMRTVLLAKNLAVSVFVFLEMLILSSICLALRLPISPLKVAEALAVTLVMMIFFAGLGNLGSVYYPRAANPQQAWRSRSGGKFQLWMLLIYPVLGFPIFLAYLARWAFDSNAAFFGVMAVTAAMALLFHHVATESAVEAAYEKRERILTALSEGDGPIA